jgi:hypothetical protein
MTEPQDPAENPDDEQTPQTPEPETQSLPTQQSTPVPPPPYAPFAAPAPAAGPTPYLTLTRNQVIFGAIGALVLALVLTFFASLVVANRVVHGLDDRGQGFAKMVGPMGPGQGYGGPFRRYRGYGNGGQGQGYGNGFPPFFPAPSAPAPSASPQSSS